MKCWKKDEHRGYWMVFMHVHVIECSFKFYDYIYTCIYIIYIQCSEYCIN